MGRFSDWTLLPPTNRFGIYTLPVVDCNLRPAIVAVVVDFSIVFFFFGFGPIPVLYLKNLIVVYVVNIEELKNHNDPINNGLVDNDDTIDSDVENSIVLGVGAIKDDVVVPTKLVATAAALDPNRFSGKNDDATAVEETNGPPLLRAQVLLCDGLPLRLVICSTGIFGL